MPIQLRDLPTVNACLNATSAVLLTAGFIFIKRKKIAAHRACMLAAFCVGVLFLVCYLIYHFQVGVTKFAGQGWIRPAYFLLLGSHTILAIGMLPFILVALIHAIKGNFEKHRKIARIALPLWWYVSVTGVFVYLILYRWYPSSAGTSS